jgi:hypothetical protein
MFNYLYLNIILHSIYQFLELGVGMFFLEFILLHCSVNLSQVIIRREMNFILLTE